MTEAQRGVLAMVAACCIWGLSALYYKLVAHVPPLEVLAHRTLWALVFFAGVLRAQGRLGQIGAILRSPRAAGLVGLAGIFIATNWLFFIWSIQLGRAVQASLGYYIFPLVAVALGAVVLREALSPVRWAAVTLAAAAVALLTWGLGVAPWFSLALAFSFGGYGLVKRWVAAGPVVSVTTEVLLLAPLALVWLWGVHAQGWVGLEDRPGAVFGTSLFDSAILMAAGPITATPLILFSYASKRVTYATVGLVQYLNPTLQFLVATLAFREPFGAWHAMAFAVIWTALAIYTAEILRQDRAARRLRASAATSGTSAT
ncbi:EamA family transporter RarD [Rhodobacteraceae bacterium WD3A24]|nr:EamA family transporter RarD [Rhodobacteraceae bacterium WD3A24]